MEGLTDFATDFTVIALAAALAIMIFCTIKCFR